MAEGIGPGEGFPGKRVVVPPQMEVDGILLTEQCQRRLAEPLEIDQSIAIVVRNLAEFGSRRLEIMMRFHGIAS
jgi:hypothetical protein